MCAVYVHVKGILSGSIELGTGQGAGWPFGHDGGRGGRGGLVDGGSGGILLGGRRRGSTL